SVSYNDEGRIAEGQFLEPRGLPLFTLEDDAGQRLCDALPEPVSTVATLMPAMVAKRTFSSTECGPFLEPHVRFTPTLIHCKFWRLGMGSTRYCGCSKE